MLFKKGSWNKDVATPEPGGASPKSGGVPSPAAPVALLVPPNHFKSTNRLVLAPEYRQYADTCTIVPSFEAPASAAVAKALAQRASLYDPASQASGVPWWVIACLHHMECDGNPLGGIDNGDPWNAPTVHVPAGRGPYGSFAEEAADALAQYQKPENWGISFTGKNWSDPGWTYFFFETWNGLGARMSLGGNTTPPYACPYIYNGVEVNGQALYLKGKEVRDNVFDPNAVSAQVGCMAFMKALEAAGEKVFG